MAAGGGPMIAPETLNTTILNYISNLFGRDAARSSFYESLFDDEKD
jgi:hypothetical protein